MKVFQWVSNSLQYVVEGFTRIFSPNKDEYPEIGVQPYSGEPFSKWMSEGNDQSK